VDPRFVLALTITFAIVFSFLKLGQLAWHQPYSLHDPLGVTSRSQVVVSCLSA
jgi:hypothetical protein